MPIPRLALAGLLLATACSNDEPRSDVPPAIDAFARGYIVALRDSGVAVVASRTVTRTTELTGFAEGVVNMRALLPTGRTDSVVVRHAEVIAQVDEPTATRVVYGVYGPAASSLVELWIEEHDGALKIETLQVTPVVP